MVLSAGALGSTEILQRSRALKLSPLLGQRFSTNGDVLALGWGMGARVNGMARADEAEQPPAERVGPPSQAGSRPACLWRASSGVCWWKKARCPPP